MKWRTMYENLDYDGQEYESSKHPSMTDESDYLSAEEILNRYQHGEILKATSDGGYDAEGDYTDEEGNTAIFEADANRTKLEAELANEGEESLARKVNSLRKKKNPQGVPPVVPEVPAGGKKPVENEKLPPV